MGDTGCGGGRETMHSAGRESHTSTAQAEKGSQQREGGRASQCLDPCCKAQGTPGLPRCPPGTVGNIVTVAGVHRVLDGGESLP